MHAAHVDGAIAVTAASGGLTYAALDTAATALAHRLRDAGVHHGDVVALSVVRDLDLTAEDTPGRNGR